MPYKYKQSEEIDDLIPAAMEEARAMVRWNGGVKFEKRMCKSGEYIHCMRSMYFHRAMDRMAKERELRV